VPTPRHAALATAALVLGGVAIGTTEFVTMGILPEISTDLAVTIPQAGHAISAYAAGVVVGAPLIAAVGASWPRKGLLLGLLAALIVGNAAAALAPGYESLVAARFLAGLPHGAYFGVASLVAIELAPVGQAGRAVGRVMLGIPVANVLGVPFATWLGQQLGWRFAYWLVVAVGALAVGLVALVVPHVARDLEGTVRRELKEFANLQVLLTLLVGAIGFGGLFAMLSYIAPTLTEVTGLAASWVPWYLLASGVGGIVGTPIAGRMADWSVLRSAVIGLAGTAANLTVFALVAQWAIPALICVFLSAVFAGILVVSLQLRLMDVARKAKTLGAASNHAAFNTANALGAWLGGLVIARGYGFTAPSWVGVGLALGGLIVLGISLLVHRREARTALG
jgi:Arabinose efflux permease